MQLTQPRLDRDNLRAALRWCLDQGDAPMGFRLARAHWNLWVVQSDLSEGRAWLAQLEALPDGAKAPALRAVVQSIDATLAWRQGDYARALELHLEALPSCGKRTTHGRYTLCSPIKA